MEEVKRLLIEGTCWDFEKDKLKEIERRYYVVGYRFVEGKGGYIRIVFENGKPKRKDRKNGKR